MHIHDEAVDHSGGEIYIVPVEDTIQSWLDHSVFTVKVNKKDEVEEIKEEDYETAISETGFGWFTILVLVMMIPGSWSSGFDTSALSMVLPIAGCELHLSSIERGWLNSAIYMGMIASAFTWGFISDTYGRQKLLTYGLFLDSLCSMATTVAPSFWVMFILKFISGCMICGPYSILMTYISEVFGEKKRDIIFLLSGVFFAIGSIIQPALGLLIIPQTFHWNLFGLLEIYPWRLYLFLCSLPSLLAACLAYFCVESPKFLYEKGRREEALDALSRIYAMNTGNSKESYPIKRLKMSPNFIATGKDGETHSLRQKFIKQIITLFSPPYLGRAVFAFTTLTGVVSVLNGLRLILPEMFSHFASTAGNSTGESELACSILMTPKIHKENCDDIVIDADVYLNMMKIYGFCCLCQTVNNLCARFIKKVVILVLSTTIPGICAILVTFLSADYIVYLAAAYISLLNVNFYAMMSVIVIMFPTSLRATSVSTSMMMARSGVLFGNLFLAGQIYSNCYFAFYFFGFVLIGVAFLSLFVPGPDESEISASSSKEIK